MIDIGPFQELTEISFPSDEDSREDWVNGEDVDFYEQCGEEEGKTTGAIGVTRNPPTGTAGTSCLCSNPAYSGGFDHGVQLQFILDTSQAWPACVKGKSSGARVSENWPDQPAGWGSSPANFISGGWGTCGSSVWTQGANSGPGQYTVIVWFLWDCAGPIAFPECCG